MFNYESIDAAGIAARDLRNQLFTHNDADRRLPSEPPGR